MPAFEWVHVLLRQQKVTMSLSPPYFCNSAGYTHWTMKPRTVAKVGTFVGRTIPVVGWVILASDVSQISYKTVRDYNKIARGNDKVW
ncbi:putative phage membrane protein [Erwinia tracheiphila PSU-1]|nr:putative phage membrane protein [Erwinia tracheiphila PSU-1]